MGAPFTVCKSCGFIKVAKTRYKRVAKEQPPVCDRCNLCALSPDQFSVHAAKIIADYNESVNKRK